MEYFETNWASLPWSPWVPFSADKHDFRQIPHKPGLYRIRPIGKDFLMYIGETQRTVHKRLNELRHNIKKTDLMPWNAPHTAAPSLWAWKDAEGFEYECSASPLDTSMSGRRGMECFLLYRYRQERGESTLCNFGRFHKRYRKSTDRKKRNGDPGIRGGKLDTSNKDNPAGGLCHPPLPDVGKPGSADWMGLQWNTIERLEKKYTRSIQQKQGLYILMDSISHEIVYVGESENCSKRLSDHSQKSWDDRDLFFSYHILETPVLPHQLKELENDLIGNYFEKYRKAPEYQFRNRK
ncbi:MAG: hypothetical protein CVV32_04160 [Methanomicrobiales archaeon HGW-Methanomicrobiales-3]|nr:MAG: hypothetical protein CVV32_04160 [Methanomicrobiales archaeon HGW-Methanomicrobiales-3]